MSLDGVHPMRLLCVVLALCCSACLSARNAARMKTIQQHEYSAMLQNMVDSHCSGREAPPGFHRKHEVRQRCGLVVNEIGTAEYWTRFASSVCANEPDEACAKKFVDMFAARLDERYPAADGEAVSAHCHAYPIECQEMRTVEIWILMSHNKAVDARYKKRIQDAKNGEELRGEAEAAETRKAVANVLFAIVEASRPPPSITCTTTAFGSMATTTCH
jgi:hypothetical protein